MNTQNTNSQEKHYENKWVAVSSFYNLPMSNGTFNLYDLIKNWESYSHSNKLEKVQVKQFYFNTGNTAYSRAESYKLFYNQEVENIYIVRFRNDGFGTQIFKWDGSVSEWENYSTSKARDEFMATMDRFNNM